MALDIKPTETLKDEAAEKFWEKHNDKSNWGTQSLNFEPKESLKLALRTLKNQKKKVNLQ